MVNRQRNKQLHFMVNKEEWEIIDKKMELIGISNIGAYLRRMAVYGYMIEVDVEPLGELSSQLNRIGHNVNQLSKRANETGNIYIDDIKKISEDINEMKELIRGFTNNMIENIT